MRQLVGVNEQVINEQVVCRCKPEWMGTLCDQKRDACVERYDSRQLPGVFMCAYPPPPNASADSLWTAAKLYEKLSNASNSTREELLRNLSSDSRWTTAELYQNLTHLRRTLGTRIEGRCVPQLGSDHYSCICPFYFTGSQIIALLLILNSNK